MKNIFLAALLLPLAACSTPNPNPKATAAAYDQVKAGMTRTQVYDLLGPPKSVQPKGDVEHCQSASWGIPHNAHGWGRWTVTFGGDTVLGISSNDATVSVSASGAN